MAEDVKIREGGSWEFIELLRIEELKSNTSSNALWVYRVTGVWHFQPSLFLTLLLRH